MPEQVTPYLIYRDAPAAINFLTSAFGFVEKYRFPMDDGRIGHAELTSGDGAVMLASEFDGFGRSPLGLPDVHGQTYCTVDDVDAHFARARANGATVTSEPANRDGTRMYRAIDPEGHRWIFAQPVEQS
ncbi:MAG TPA: VOC family protein [Vicinamibacterales bacterium]|nr:VOC family protein [Vicinamibacterales bacterium]